MSDGLFERFHSLTRSLTHISQLLPPLPSDQPLTFVGLFFTSFAITIYASSVSEKRTADGLDPYGDAFSDTADTWSGNGSGNSEDGSVIVDVWGAGVSKDRGKKF